MSASRSLDKNYWWTTVTEQIKNLNHVKSKTITNTLSMNNFKKAIKPKQKKYQNIIAKENYIYLKKVSPNLANPQFYFMKKWLQT